MKTHPQPLANGTAESSPANTLQRVMPHRLPAADPAPSRGRNRTAVGHYFVAIGSTTFQVGIAIVDGGRYFRLSQAAGA